MGSSELQVTMNLQKGDDDILSRGITFDFEGGSLQVGRASKTGRRQLVAAKDNMWISNPVISREHAILSVERNEVVDTFRVFLEDEKSSHGTFVNEENIRKKGKKQLRDGDLVQFGDHVLRGAESFEPPVYHVSFKTFDTHAPTSLPTTVGRSYSVPDDDDESEGSEMDESDSDVPSLRSIDSHSSPSHEKEMMACEFEIDTGNSMNDPFQIDNPQAVVIQDSVLDRESESYDAEAYFEENISQQDLPESEEEGMDHADIDPFFERPESPAYAPMSPAARHFELAAPAVTQLPSLPSAIPGSHFTPQHHYTQGPFAQPLLSLDMDSYEPMPAAPSHFAPCPEPFEMHPEPKFQTSATIASKACLHSYGSEARARANKKNMSINSLINPPTVAGAKRKADEISDDEQEPELEHEAAADVGGESTSGAETSVVADALSMVETEQKTLEVVVKSVKGEPSAKRRRTFVSHLGSFALGGIAVFAGLVCLPDNYFG